jgi:hypothetical protein
MERKKGARQQELEGAEHLGTEGSVEGGVSGGGAARDMGSQDDMKRGFERPAGATRVQKEEKSKARHNSSR